MMFSSRPPFNDDPKPWRTDPDGKEVRSAERWKLRPYYGEYAPRPEFDRPQHNPTNPVLVDSRIALQAGKRPDEILLRFMTSVNQAGHFITLDWERVTDANVIQHARRVLTRLVNLTKESDR